MDIGNYVLAGVIGIALVVSLLYALGPLERKAKKPKPKKPDKKKENALAKLKEIQTKAEIPPNTPPPVAPTARGLEQVDIPKQIQIELVRVGADGKRATVRRGRVTLVARFGNKDIFWFYVGPRGYFVDPSKIIKVQGMTGGRHPKAITTEKLVYDVLCPEPLNQDGTITWSWDIEHLLRDSAMDQYITVATFESSFQLTPPLIRAALVIAFIGLLIGISINGATHVVPTTEIHWVP